MNQNQTIINMTPHAINICSADGQISQTIPASGQLIRLAVKTVPAGNCAGIPLSKSVFGNPEGLPKFQSGIFYIVSQLVKSALPGRYDLLVPAEMVRDANGQIVGCRSLGV